MICCWTSKGGSGTSVVAAALAIAASRLPQGALLVDLAGDQPAVLGCAEPQGPGVADWLDVGIDAPPDALGRMECDIAPNLRLLPWQSPGTEPARAVSPAEVLEATFAEVLCSDPRTVVVDAGTLGNRASAIATACARAAGQSLLVVRPCYLALRRVSTCGVGPSGVVVVTESWRALTSADVSAVVGSPVVAEIGAHPGVARAVDAGLLVSAVPRRLAPLARLVA